MTRTSRNARKAFALLLAVSMVLAFLPMLPTASASSGLLLYHIHCLMPIETIDEIWSYGFFASRLMKSR